jgi:hypothetical protein
MKIIAKHILGDRPPIELDDSGWIVEFGDEEGRLNVAACADGKIDVRSPGGHAINVEPRAANSVWISSVSLRSKI